MFERIIDKRVNGWHLIIEHNIEKDYYDVWEFYKEEGRLYEIEVMCAPKCKSLQEAKKCVGSTFRDII